METNTQSHNITAQSLAVELGIESLTAELLVKRGYGTTRSAKAFLCPNLSDLSDFTQYTGVTQAIDRVKSAIANGEKIIVYGDYDCDGVCASAILSEALKEKGADVEVYIPKRLKEGYGLSRDALEKLAEESFPDLIITVDCGITSRDDIAYCIDELGIDVVVTDHHEPPKEIPECIVVNPHLDEDKGYFSDFCGAGVAFMLVLTAFGIDFSAKYLDIVAIATMGDIVPLRQDNRILVHYGLKKMEKSPCLGIKMMFESLGQKSHFTATDVAFKIVPRINSLGRLGDAKRGLSLFTATDYFVLDCLIKDMNNENQARRALCDKVEQEAIEYAKPYLNNSKVLVLCGNWHPGVLGIVASRLTDRFIRPTIMFSYEDGVLKGSCRSIDKINIYELLSKFSHRFIRFGGHAQAAGVSMEASQFEIFREEIIDYAKTFPDDMFVPTFNYDADITGETITRKFLVELERFEPFGEGNPEPIFHAEEGRCRYKHAKTNVAHLSATTNYGYSISAFYKGGQLSLLNSPAKKHCYYTLGINIFNDKEYPQAVLKDVVVDNFDAIDKNDDELITYAKTINFPQKEAQLLDKTEFFRIITDLCVEDAYGTLIVCFTKATYDIVKSNLSKSDVTIQSYYGANTFKNSLNAIVYCPLADFDYSIFENVFFADKPLAFPEENDFGLYSVEDCSLYNLLCNLKLQREDVGEYFKLIKPMLSSTSVRSVQSAIALIKPSDELLFALSWQILMDVGLLAKNEDGIFYIKNIRTELTNSPLYCIINQNG